MWLQCTVWLPCGQCLLSHNNGSPEHSENHKLECKWGDQENAQLSPPFQGQPAVGSISAPGPLLSSQTRVPLRGSGPRTELSKGTAAGPAAQCRTSPVGSLHSGPLRQPGLALLRTTLQSPALPTPPSFPILLLHNVLSALQRPLRPSQASVPADLVHV